MVPKNITREHIEKAIEEIDVIGIRKGRHSSTYDLIYNDKSYPPKLVLSIANRFVNGRELSPSDFDGGKGTEGFKLLEDQGFTIIKKSKSWDYQIISEYINLLNSDKLSAANSIKKLVRKKSFENNIKVLDQFFFNEKLKVINSTNYQNIIEFLKEQHNIVYGEYNDFNIWSHSKNHLNKVNRELVFRHNELNDKVGFPDNGNGLYKSFLGEKNLILFIKKKFENPNNLNYENKDNEIMDFPLNTIFYGPPGTGKTYNTISRAAQIIKGNKIDSYDEALEIFNSNLHDRIEFITFHQNYSYEDFIQGLRPETDGGSTLMFKKKDGVFKRIADRANENLKLAQEKQLNNAENYVIIIDEINRANISRVFGELITLIEPDKRSHGLIPLETRLPSGDHFIVPSNLFIIGTMNTADKSIALLDIALRRRFEFESMYPKYKIDNKEIHDVEILKKINEQIIKLKGYDFQIGHAYFMGVNNDLVHRMNKKVIPLLLEYFMNDEKEVSEILKSAGLSVNENYWPLTISGKG